MADKTYLIVAAPLAVVRDKGSKLHYVYEGSLVQAELSDDERDRLINRGLVKRCNEQGVVIEHDERTVATPAVVVAERPHLTAPVSEWVDYAVARGMARERAEAVGKKNKRDLIDAYPAEA